MNLEAHVNRLRLQLARDVMERDRLADLLNDARTVVAARRGELRDTSALLRAAKAAGAARHE